MTNTSSNPFDAQLPQDINIDKFAEEMALTLKKLNEKEKDRNELSDNSLGSGHPFKNAVDKNANVDGYKRENPTKITTAVPRKRVKANSEYEGPNDDSQFIDSISNRKITEFFNIKARAAIADRQKEDIKNSGSYSEDNEEQEMGLHPVIRSLREKISKKQKSIEELSGQVERIREKYERAQEEIASKKENQLSILIEFLCEKYESKIYSQKMKDMQRGESSRALDRRILNEVIDKIDLLKNEKNIKKSSKRGSVGNEETNLLEMYGEERQSYLATWKKRLEAEKQSIEKEVLRVSLCEEVELIEEKYNNLPKHFLDESGSRKIFDKVYLPLYCRHETDSITQIRVLNLSKLVFENFTLLPYPTTMRKDKRMEMKARLRETFTKSLLLSDEVSHSIFTNNTIFSQVEGSQKELIVMGRSIWQQELPTITLGHLLKRYQVLPENIAKYIIKTVLRAHERVRKEICHECIILPDNIIFNDRNDLKIDNWMLNEIYRVSEYNEHLLRDGKYLYLPPDYKLTLYAEETRGNGMGIWSVGVLLYEMLFGRKPFTYGKDVDHEEFYMMNELEFPAKPQVADSCKQLLRVCLCKPQNRISFERALKHSFFDFKK